MKNILTLLIIFTTTLSFAQNSGLTNTDTLDIQSKLLNLDIKKYNFAKSKGDSKVLEQTLKEITINQNSLDTLVIAQMLDYVSFSNAYSNLLDSVDKNYVYSKNKLHKELFSKIEKLLSGNKLLIDTGQIVTNKYLNNKIDVQIIKNTEDNNANFTTNNISNIFINGIIKFYSTSNALIFKSKFTIEPNALGETITTENITTKEFYFIVRISYFDNDNNEIHTYFKSKNYSNKFSYNIICTSSMDNINNNNIPVTNETIKFFNTN